MEIEKLTDSFGARIHGLDLSIPLNREEHAELHKAWLDYQVLIFPDQVMTEEDQIAFTKYWGEMPLRKRYAGRREEDRRTHESVMLISNIREDGEPIGSLPDGDMMFHSDGQYDEHPYRYTMLYALEVPKSGGNTLFGNCYDAYEALPDKLKKIISGRKVLQVYDYTIRTKPRREGLDRIPHFWQPVVVQHPVTGRKALYLDRLMTAAIDGFTETESDELLAELFPYVERADYEHKWRLGDYVIWDNRCTVHARREFPSDQRRLLKRGKVEGNALIAAG